jgi:trans-2,3-dihydro-3-hydroxyanthranilate isomerase
LGHPLHIVDVFAEAPYGGNQLAVILRADDLTSDEMQRVALEMNFSETTFVSSAGNVEGGFPVRIFTPSLELPFAGHPTLGTAWVIRRYFAEGSPEVVRLNLGVGQVPVRFEKQEGGSELVWLLSPPIELGPTFQSETIAPALSLSRDDIDERVPIQRVSAGVSPTIVPLRGLDALRRSRLDLEAFAPLRREGLLPFLYLFSPEPRSAENDLSVRFFFDANGIREDPATGSAAACLGGYLLEHEYFPGKELYLRVEQGHEINRPSLLLLRARRTSGAPEITVGGHVIPSARGEIL